MAYSTLNISFTQTKKSVVCTGTVAVREQVTVLIAAGWDLVSSGLSLKIQTQNNFGLTAAVAFYPLTVSGTLQTWKQANSAGVEYVTGPTTGYTYAKCTLNLNTTELLAVFATVPNMGFRPFNILVYTTTGPTLASNGVISIMNFPSTSTVAPTTISQAATLAAIEARVVDLEAQATITPVYTDFAGITDLAYPTNTWRQLVTKVEAILAILKGE